MAPAHKVAALLTVRQQPFLPRLHAAATREAGCAGGRGQASYLNGYFYLLHQFSQTSVLLTEMVARAILRRPGGLVDVPQQAGSLRWQGTARSWPWAPALPQLLQQVVARLEALEAGWARSLRLHTPLFQMRKLRSRES